MRLPIFAAGAPPRDGFCAIFSKNDALPRFQRRVCPRHRLFCSVALAPTLQESRTVDAKRMLKVATVAAPVSRSLLDAALVLARECGETVPAGECGTAAFFAALAVKVTAPDADVRIVAGFRERPGEHWSHDPHVWIRVNRTDYEATPAGWPPRGAYLEAASASVAETVRHVCLSGQLITRLLSWPAEPADPFR